MSFHQAKSCFNNASQFLRDQEGEINQEKFAERRELYSGLSHLAQSLVDVENQLNNIARKLDR